MPRILSACCVALLLALNAWAAGDEPAFSVASIKPSAASVQFESDGKTEVTPLGVTMRDVTAATCIKWAYGIQDSQITGPDRVRSEHYDISARVDEPVREEQLKRMMQTLLAERFELRFHKKATTLSVFAMTVAKGGPKLKRSVGEGTPFRQNSKNGTIAKFTTVQEFGDFLAGPLERPVVDRTGLEGRYDFVLDFTAYLPENAPVMRPELVYDVIYQAMQGELGLKLEATKLPVEVFVVDSIGRPSAN